MSAIQKTGVGPRKNSRWELELKRLRQNKYLLSMLIPAIAFYVIFHYLPMYGITIAFKNFNFKKGILGSDWAGLVHFEKLFGMASFWKVFRNTFIISFYKLIFTFPAPIIFAVLINEIGGGRFKKTVQTISYLPHFLSWVVLGGMFIQILSPVYGPINLILGKIGIQPIHFLADTSTFRSVLVITTIWKGVGWGSIIYLAALTGIDPELYEAADLDGANRLQKVLHISIPSILPIISIQLIFAVGGIVNDDFDQVFNLYNSSVYSVGDVLSTYIHRYGLVNFEYGLSTAAGVFKNIIAFVLILATNYASRCLGDYGIW